MAAPGPIQRPLHHVIVLAELDDAVVVVSLEERAAARPRLGRPALRCGVLVEALDDEADRVVRDLLVVPPGHRLLVGALIRGRVEAAALARSSPTQPVVRHWRAWTIKPSVERGAPNSYYQAALQSWARRSPVRFRTPVRP